MARFLLLFLFSFLKLWSIEPIAKEEPKIENKALPSEKASFFFYAKQDPKQKEEETKLIKKEAEQIQNEKELSFRKNFLSYSDPVIYGPFLTVSWLYCKPSLPNFLPAKVNQNADPTDLNQKEERPDFDWESGFKLGLGINLEHGQFDVYTYWTSLNAKAQNTLTSSNYAIESQIRFNASDLTKSDFVNSLSYYAKFNLNSVDLEVGKSFYPTVNSYFSLRPFLGLKWIDLKEEFFAVAKTASTSEDYPKYMELPYKFQGIGLSCGLNSCFHIVKHFSLVGNLNPALLYGKTKTTLITVQNSGHLDQEKITLTNEKWQLMPYLKVFAGLNFGSAFFKNRTFWSLNFGWQFDLFLDTNSSISPLNEINSTLELSSFVAELRSEF